MKVVMAEGRNMLCDYCCHLVGIVLFSHALKTAIVSCIKLKDLLLKF